MGWLHRLFGAHAPEDPPENYETRRLLEEARRLSQTARGTLPDRETLVYEARDAALCHGYGENAALVELLTDLAVALVDAATVAALPNDLTVQHALRDILAGAELRERLRDTLEYLRHAERHHDLISSVIRDILYEATATLAAPTEGEIHRALFRVPLLTFLEDPAEAVSAHHRAALLGRRARDPALSQIPRPTHRQSRSRPRATAREDRAGTVSKNIPTRKPSLRTSPTTPPFSTSIPRHSPLPFLDPLALNICILSLGVDTGKRSVCNSSFWKIWREPKKKTSGSRSSTVKATSSGNSSASTSSIPTREPLPTASS